MEIVNGKRRGIITIIDLNADGIPELILRTKGSGGMPYLVREYKLVNRKIKLVNEAYWIKYERGIKAGENDYQLNGKKCTEEEFQEIYKSIGSVIKLVPNSAKNRKKLGVNGA